MAIHIPVAPSAGMALVRETLPLSPPPPPGPHLMLAQSGQATGNEANAQPDVRAPYPVYSTSLEDLFTAGLASAELTAWQYVIETNGDAQSLAEVAVVDFIGDRDQALSYAAELAASNAKALLAAIADAEGYPPAAENEYELRILRVPAIYLLAIWLQRDGDDWLRLVRGTRAGVQAGSWLRENELLEALRPLAQIRRNATDR